MKGANVRKTVLQPSRVAQEVAATLGAEPPKALEKRTLYRRGVAIASTFEKVKK